MVPGIRRDISEAGQGIHFLRAEQTHQHGGQFRAGCVGGGFQVAVLIALEDAVLHAEGQRVVGPAVGNRDLIADVDGQGLALLAGDRGDGDGIVALLELQEIGLPLCLDGFAVEGDGDLRRIQGVLPLDRLHAEALAGRAHHLTVRQVDCDLNLFRRFLSRRRNIGTLRAFGRLGRLARGVRVRRLLFRLYGRRRTLQHQQDAEQQRKQT